MKNYNDVKTASGVKSAARDDAFMVLKNAFSDYFGEDNVSIVDNCEIAVAIGTRILSDGTEGEVCVTIKPVAKDFDSRVTDSGKEFMPYERLVEADNYQEYLSEKAAQKAEKEKAKAARKK